MPYFDGVVSGGNPNIFGPLAGNTGSCPAFTLWHEEQPKPIDGLPVAVLAEVAPLGQVVESPGKWQSVHLLPLLTSNAAANSFLFVAE